MKHLSLIILITVSINPICAMEKSLSDINKTVDKPYLTIINQLPTNNPYLPNPHIDVFHETIAEDIITYYKTNPEKPHKNATSIKPNESTNFSLPKNVSININTYDQMHGFDDNVTVYMYAPVKIRLKLFKIYFNKFYPVKYGDTITFTLNTDDNIILTRSRDNFAITNIPLIKAKNHNLKASILSYVTIVNKLKSNRDYFSDANIDVFHQDENIKNYYKNNPSEQHKSAIRIKPNETIQFPTFPCDLSEKGEISVPFYIDAAIKFKGITSNHNKPGDIIIFTYDSLGSVWLKKGNDAGKKIETRLVTENYIQNYAKNSAY